jgi:pimeloyl-ACP methyl ester carboxylesterase
MHRSLLGATALAVGAIGGTVLGYLAERTMVDPAEGPGERQRAGGRGSAEPTSEVPHGVPREVKAADGTRLSVMLSGPDDVPPIVLVHGMSLTKEIWTLQRQALEHAYRIVTFDLRGHGDSDDAASGEYTAHALGGDVCTVIDMLGERQCVVVGHSMGGMALLAALAQRPDLMEGPVAGVVLINTAASAVISGLSGGSVAAVIAFMRERARSSLVGRALYGGLDEHGLPRGNDLATLVTRTLGVGSDGPEEAVRQVRRLVLDSRPHVAGEMWRTAGTLDELAAARNVSVPALIIAGARDRVLPPHHSRRLLETLPDAELVELTGVGHVAMLERPDEVTALIAGFARRVLGLPAGYGDRQRNAEA